MTEKVPRYTKVRWYGPRGIPKQVVMLTEDTKSLEKEEQCNLFNRK